MTSALRFPLEPLDPGPDTAREWLRDELSRPEYQPSLVERFQRWVEDLLGGVRDASEAIGGFNPVLAVAVLALLLAAGALVLSRLRANPSADDGERPLFDEVRRSSATHRELARQAAERADWHTVVVESTRALAAGLFERGVVVEDVGATAHEISTSAGRAFPEARERLDRAAAVFDETLYGDHAADEPRAREVVALEVELSAATPSASTDAAPVAVVPR